MVSKEFYNLVRKHFNNGDSLLNYAKEIHDIECALNKKKTICYLANTIPQALVGAEFILNSESWTVKQAKANGHYRVEKLVDNSERYYYVKNLDTNEIYISDIENIAYFISHEGCQDYRYIYMGWYGDYKFLG